MFLSRNFHRYLTGCIHSSPRKLKKSGPTIFIVRRQYVSCSSCVRRNLTTDVKNVAYSSEFVSISHIKQTLLKYNRIFEDGYACINSDCVFCEGKSKMFINKITGYFICYGCDRAGSWEQLEPLIHDSSWLKHSHLEKDSSIVTGASSWEKVSKHLRPIVDLDENARLAVLRRLELESLPWNVLENHQVMFDDKNEELYWPLSLLDEKTVPGYKTINADLTENCCPHSSAAGVIRFNADKAGRSKTAIVVPTLRDLLALTLYQMDDVDIVCLPHGQFSLPQSVLPLLEEYGKLVLWFAGDVTSWDNVRLFARKLSVDRCHLIRPMMEHKSAFEAHKSRLDVVESIRNSKAMSHSSIITFQQLRDDLLTELYCSDQATGIKWTRFPGLNSILQGHRRGELTILTGPTGSGKTTFMSEYSLDLAMQKVTTLWGSFEIRNQRLVRTMLQQMAGIPLQKNRDKFDEWADAFALLPLYFMTFHGQQHLDTVMETVKHAAYVHDVAHVIIDNVQFMLGLSSSESGFLDRFYRQDALIGAFRNFASTHNCHVTLVIHPRKERDGESLTTSSIFGGAKASQEADNVLIIQNKFSHSGLKIKKYLQVAKNRFSGDLGIIPLEFDRESLSFGADKKKS